ncbi:MAG TPA: tetratricopeptide repeat protein [Blastocatellia bacterium]|nr:tetratricopeptide repeat protein [Blastocatellia bacterium]
MKDKLCDDETYRLYLLGELNGSQRDQIEERILLDNDCFEQMSLEEDSLIEEYLDDGLTSKERDRFENYYLIAPEHRAKLKFAQTLQKYVSLRVPEPVPPPIISSRRWVASRAYLPYLKVAAAALILVGVAAGVWRVFIRESDVDKGMAALKLAFKDTRPGETRLSSFGYAEHSQVRGGPVAPSNDQDIELAQARIYLNDAAKEEPGAASFHALGLLYLAEAKFDDAIGRFKEALTTAPNDPELLSDLGAALYEEGKRDREESPLASGTDPQNQGVRELNESHAYLDRALKLKPSLPEALFNRALCYEQLGETDLARQDWEQYLKLDPNSEWTSEAARHLKRNK